MRVCLDRLVAYHEGARLQTMKVTSKLLSYDRFTGLTESNIDTIEQGLDI